MLWKVSSPIQRTNSLSSIYPSF